MYLKALRMRGFKSFPGSVELKFDHGIAVVVGPNGSGKSNIADALQWAMAVSSPVQLRAPTGEDVLFTGSDSRPPAGVCEVELVLDNECATLPLEFGEVSIMRRLYRGGESEYLINRARVRRLDVLELLGDTGLGREMHSVIGQGKVEEILLSKPHERRRFVEEAAGLGKYQRRRARAESKLVRVAAELERARDLEREVSARLRPLALQATAAERAAKLAGEIASGRVALLTSEAVVEERRARTARDRLAGTVAEREAAEGRLRELASRRAAAEAELTGLAAAQERAGHAFYAFETARERLALAADRLVRVQAALGRARARREAAAAHMRADTARLEGEAVTAEATARAAAQEADVLAAADSGAAAAAAAAAEAAQVAAMDARRGLAEAQGQAATARREAETAARRADELRTRAAELAEVVAGRGEQLGEVTGSAASAAEELRASDSAEAAAAGAFDTAQDAADAAASAEREARAAAAHAEAALEVQRTRLEALERTIERGEGLTPGARALRAAGAELVAAAVEAHAGYERAVAAALGWRAGAVVAERLDDAIALLGKADGEVGVVLRDARPLETALPPCPGARPLREVVEVRDPVALRLIDGVWLVDDLARVERGVAVTADGAGIDVDRGELWRATGAGEAAWMAARAERDRLAAAIADDEREAAHAARRAAAAASTAQAAAGALASARERLSAAQAAHSAAQAEARAAAARRDRLADELARADAAADMAAHDLEAETRRGADIAAAAAGLESVLEQRRAEAEAADERNAALEHERRRLADDAAARGARVAALRERAERHAHEASRLGSEAAAATAGAERAAALAASAAAVAGPAEAVSEGAAAAAAAGERLRAPAHAGIEEIEQRASTLSAELQACAADEAAEQGRARDLAAAATEVEVGLARSGERLDELKRRRDALVAEFDIEAPEAPEPLAPDEAAATAARLERLERRREALGAVNPLAAQEYEEAKARAGEIADQCADLERSLRELRRLIRDLTSTIDRRFAETFGAVAKNFSEVIGTLFPGGSGRLRLTDDVVAAAPTVAVVDEESEEGAEERLEPGIELEVRPAGKRIEALSLLSGGEKSLTAIAFLFALLLTKPSPFYLLDEVEAALDDANIERFLDLLRAYQSRAQFIVVTHQRRTMEVADVLYGVTMAGDGESRVLSRRMPAEAGPRAVSA
jgi:chromosome segregation protein